MMLYNKSWHRANRHLLMLALRKRYDIVNRAYGRFWRPSEDTEPMLPAYAPELKNLAEKLHLQPRTDSALPPPSSTESARLEAPPRP